MPGFSDTIGINATAAGVFGFLSNIDNLPRYLPGVEKAVRAGADRVHLRGATNGRRYALDGRLLIDGERLQMALGAFDPGACQLAFQVFASDDGAELAGRIAFKPDLAIPNAGAGGGAAGAAFVRWALEIALLAVKQAVESQPQAAGESPDWRQAGNPYASGPSAAGRGEPPPSGAPQRRNPLMTASWPLLRGPQICQVTPSPP
jgi:hypothetical protein